MKTSRTFSIVTLFIVLSLLTISCSKKEEDKKPEASNNTSAGKSEVENESDISYAEGRKIYRIEKADLNNDKADELIVLSMKDKDGDDPAGIVKFDMLEVFAQNEAKSKYVKISSDTVDFAFDAKLTDMSTSGNKQIFIFTNSGGNSTVASEGLFVFAMTSPDSVKLVKYFDSGSPKIIEGNQGKPNLIAVTDLFHGVMPMAYAVPFISSIYEYKNNELVISNEKYPEYFDKSIEQSIENYKGMKRKVEMGMQMADMSYPLYREAAEVIVNYRSKGDLTGLKKFWDEEKDSLKKNIPEDEFRDLSNLVSKVIPQVNNA